MTCTSLMLRTVFLLGVFTLIGCQKDDDNLFSSSDEHHFRMEAFEVETDPAHREVRILFQVRDKEFNGVAGITAADLNVYENGGAIDSEGGLSLNPGNIPSDLKTVLLLDISRSVEGLVPQIKAACIKMIENKLPEQRIAIYTFNSSTDLLQDFTTDEVALKAALNGIPETNLINSTNLYGAVIDVADLWEDVFTIQGIVDGSLIVFTDGRHNANPGIVLDDAKDAIEGKKIYVAALKSPDLDEASLKSLAGRADRYFKADNVAGLEEMFVNIQEEISRLSRSIYYLTYQSPITDPSPRDNSLKVEIDGNRNGGTDKLILESFNSVGFGN
jgi:uncharacterized protein YegL